MAGSVPWSVNAVDPEAWADARDAARRSGQSVGEWLEAAIRNAANDRQPPRAPSNESDAIERRLDDIAERIELFSRQREPSPSARASRGDTALLSSIEALNQRVDALSRDMRAGEKNGPAEVRAAIQKLEDRIEHLLSRGRIAEAGASPELERKLEGISRSIESMSRQLAQENLRYENERFEREGGRHDAAPVPSSVEELDNAVAEIMMRQSVLDGTPPPRNIPRAAPRAEAPREREARELPQPDLSGLERQLKHMTEEMQALRTSALQNDAIGTLRGEIAELAAKLGELAPRRSLESIERAIDSIALRVDRAGGTRQDETLTEVVDALHDIRSALADVRPAESFISVEKDLHALSNKLDNLGGRGIDNGAVARLQEQTAEIRDLLSGALPSDVLRALVDQIELLVSKFEERRGAPDSALLDVMSAFDRRIETLSERIEAATRQTPPAPALDEIRRRLDELQDAVARDGEGSGDRLEATLRALAQKVDATDARLSNLGSIERGLSDLFAQLEEARASAQEAAERAAKSAVREMAAAQPASVEFTRRAPGEPVETRYSGGVELRAEPASAVRETPRPELRPLSSLRPVASTDLEEEIAPDLPLEPGSGAPRLRLQSAALRVAQSEAALGDLAAPASETPVRTSDFIAAARRAAQAANAEPAPEPEKSGVSAIGRISSLLGRSRRALMIGLALCLLALVAFRLFDGWLPNPFRAAAPTAPAPTVVAPKANTSAMPAPAPQAALPEKQDSRAQALAGDAFAATPPAGILGGDSDLHFFGEPAPSPETTGSTNTRRSATGSIQTAAAPAESTVAAPADDTASALPAALGTTALRAAAIGGDPVAAYEIGVRYLDGRGVRADTAEAIKWLEQAHAKGSILAAYRLGSIHEKGADGRKNPAEALRYYKAAAEGGNIKAMHNLAVVYAEGPEGQADMKSALHWFRMAAERGVRDSQYNLGVLYARGLGVEQNFAESYRWFAIAANQGDGDAGKKRDDVAKRLDVQTLVAARLAVQTWTAAKTNPAANEVSLRPEWEAEAPARKRSVKK